MDAIELSCWKVYMDSLYDTIKELDEALHHLELALINSKELREELVGPKEMAINNG